MRLFKLGSVSLLMFAVAACNSLDDLTDLEVTNQNNPDRARALAEAQDIEALIGGGFLAWHDGTQNDDPTSPLSTAADEGTASWGNYGAQQISSEPRVAWPNSSSWRYARFTENPWFRLYGGLSAVFDGLQALDADDGTICSEIDCDRARAFAKFTQGITLGFLALMYDSAFILEESVDLATDVLDLQGYPAVMAAAIGLLDQGIAASANAGWSTPSSWYGLVTVSGPELAELGHAHRARLLSSVGRTPAERANAPWLQIIQDVDQGVTEDFWIPGDGEVLWYHSGAWLGAQPGTTWHRADYKSIGWTDTGTDYANWLATPVAQRKEFDFQPLDERIVPPGDVQGVGVDFKWQGNSRFRADRGTYHFSRYKGQRYKDYAESDGQTPEPHINFNAQQALKAEGLLRTGDAAGAAALINVSRARGNLPAATAGDADLMQKIFYEYQMENYYTCGGCLYFARRGWGPLSPTGPAHHFGLVEGTPLHYAVPGKELEILQKLQYTYGGVGEEGSSLAPAAVSAASRVDGVPARLVYSFDGLTTLKEKLAKLREGQRIPHHVSRMVRH